MKLDLLDSDLFALVAASGPLNRLILLILLVFSVSSWAIIFFKWRFLRRAATDNRRFLVLFDRGGDLPDLRRKVRSFSESPLAEIFAEVTVRLTPYLGETDEHRVLSLRSVQSWLRSASEKQIIRLEQHLSFLATTGNVTPFIGLLGTVLGIMNSFQSIGTQGTANIAAVAPGVAEALLATAAGLFAAIPAVVAYNFYLNRVKLMANEMETFSAEMINRVEEQIQKESVPGSH